MKVWRRPSFGTAGPLGGDHPLVTKEGHHVLDVIFTTPIQDLGKPYVDGWLEDLPSLPQQLGIFNPA
jgi:hypothetical protein